MRGVEAKKACPSLELVQVPVAHGKADIGIYRNAGERVVDVLSKRYKCVVERASVDEVYLDVTEESERMLERWPSISAEILQHATAPGVIVAAGDCGGEAWLTRQCSSLEEDDEDEGRHPDRLLLCASALVSQLRRDVLDRLGYTCSAGIAHTKMLAKVVSAMNKPNKQTIVPHCGVSPLMQTVPLSRLKGFGGKLGQTLQEEFGVSAAADLLEIGMDRLLAHFDRAQCVWMLSAARGDLDEPLTPRTFPNIISCGKTFRGPSSLPSAAMEDGRVKNWLTALSTELTERLEGAATHGRFPKHIGVSFSVKLNNAGKSVTTSSPVSLSKNAPFPHRSHSPEQLSVLFYGMITSVMEKSDKVSISSSDPWHIVSIYVHASSFETRASSKQNIATLLASVSPSKSSNSSMCTDSRERTSEKSCSTPPLKRHRGGIQRYYSPQTRSSPTTNISSTLDGTSTDSTAYDEKGLQPLESRDSATDRPISVEIGNHEKTNCDINDPIEDKEHISVMSREGIDDIDMEVFNSLPEALQKELSAHYKLGVGSTQRSRADMSGTMRIPKTKTVSAVLDERKRKKNGIQKYFK